MFPLELLQGKKQRNSAPLQNSIRLPIYAFDPVFAAHVFKHGLHHGTRRMLLVAQEGPVLECIIPLGFALSLRQIPQALARRRVGKTAVMKRFEGTR